MLSLAFKREGRKVLWGRSRLHTSWGDPKRIEYINTYPFLLYTRRKKWILHWSAALIFPSCYDSSIISRECYVGTRESRHVPLYLHCSLDIQKRENALQSIQCKPRLFNFTPYLGEAYNGSQPPLLFSLLSTVQLFSLSYLHKNASYYTATPESYKATKAKNHVTFSFWLLRWKNNT